MEIVALGDTVPKGEQDLPVGSPRFHASRFGGGTVGGSNRAEWRFHGSGLPASSLGETQKPAGTW